MTPEDRYASRVTDQAYTVPKTPGMIKPPKARVPTVQEVMETLQPQGYTADQKTEILGKGLVYVVWVQTLTFAGVLILIAILYTYPLNIIILFMAIAMSLVELWMTKKYMSG
jgi:hypothetical protein